MCCAGSYWNKEKSTCESIFFLNMSFRFCQIYCASFKKPYTFLNSMKLANFHFMVKNARINAIAAPAYVTV